MEGQTVVPWSWLVAAFAGGATVSGLLVRLYMSSAAASRSLPPPPFEATTSCSAVGDGLPPRASSHEPPLPEFVMEALRDASSSVGAAEGWRLFYWPGLPGRGEFMRLLFEATGTPYEDVFAKKTWTDVAPLNYAPGKPFFAFPAIAHGDFFLSQTPVIVRYMAKKLNGGELYPKHKRDRYQAEVLLAGVVDLVAEGHDAWHAIDKNAGYLQQKKETEPFVQYYKTKRLPKWLAYFETALQRNYEGRSFFIGQALPHPFPHRPLLACSHRHHHELTYVDLCVFHVLDGIAFQCPEEWESIDAPLLKAFHERIGALPAIALYLQSDRRFPFSGTGPIF